LTDNAVSIALAEQMWKEGKIVSAICHGPAAIVNIKDANQKNIVTGRRVTCFSNTEEEQVKLTKAIPYLVETKLKEVLLYLGRSEANDSWVASMPRMMSLGGHGWRLMDNLSQEPIRTVENNSDRPSSKPSPDIRKSSV
jgi:putative intracellular protease/amidase